MQSKKKKSKYTQDGEQEAKQTFAKCTHQKSLYLQWPSMSSSVSVLMHAHEHTYTYACVSLITHKGKRKRFIYV